MNQLTRQQKKYVIGLLQPIIQKNKDELGFCERQHADKDVIRIKFEIGACEDVINYLRGEDPKKPRIFLIKAVNALSKKYTKITFEWRLVEDNEWIIEYCSDLPFNDIETLEKSTDFADIIIDFYKAFPDKTLTIEPKK